MAEQPAVVASSVSTLHTLGYEVHRGFCTVSEGALKDLIGRTERRGALGVIFNSYVRGDSHVGDHRRYQVALDPLENGICQTIQAAVAKLLPSHCARDWVLVKSKAGCKEQSPHVDFFATPSLERASDAEMPLVLLVAVMPQTRLVVWPRSIGWMGEDARLPMRAPKETLCLEAGDAVVFRGDLVHAGAAYASDHVRLHCFLDNPKIKRGKNATMHMKLRREADGLFSIDCYPAPPPKPRARGKARTKARGKKTPKKAAQRKKTPNKKIAPKRARSVSPKRTA